MIDAIANSADLSSIRGSEPAQVYIPPVARSRIIPRLIGIIHLEMNISVVGGDELPQLDTSYDRDLWQVQLKLEYNSRAYLRDWQLARICFILFPFISAFSLVLD